MSRLYGYEPAFRCDSLTLNDSTITLTLENMIVQPYADFGEFGYGESHREIIADKRGSRFQKAYPNSRKRFTISLHWLSNKKAC